MFDTNGSSLLARGKGMQQRPLDRAREAQAAQHEHITSVAGSGPSPAQQIASATGLLDAGTITQHGFDALKAKALPG